MLEREKEFWRGIILENVLLEDRAGLGKYQVEFYGERF